MTPVRNAAVAEMTAAPAPTAALAVESAKLQLPVRNVFACIAAVSSELARTGIAKDRTNAAQGFKFRGIDDVLNVAGPIMARNGLVVIPQIVQREVTERQTRGGAGVLFNVVVTAEFKFVSATDGSSTIVRTYGEAMDTGDKATNKAMSAAYKYAALLTFAIPTEGDNDADASSPGVILPTPPAGFDAWFKTIVASADKGLTKLKRAWADSPKEFRAYATDFRKEQWEGAKTRATELDKVKPEAGA